MPPLIRLEGQRFARLTVIQRVAVANSRAAVWRCQCECGRTVLVAADKLKNGNTRSCGCLKLEELSARQRTHGRSRTTEYVSWCCAKQRCYNRRHNDFALYGGRGITMCDEWRESFEAFLADMGPKPRGCTLERRDTDGPYSRDNCVWATWSKQANNKRNNHRVTYKGRTHTIAQWASITGISDSAISDRLRLGWSIERALTTRVSKR